MSCCAQGLLIGYPVLSGVQRSVLELCLKYVSLAGFQV